MFLPFSAQITLEVTSNPFEPPRPPVPAARTWTERWSRFLSVFKPRSPVDRFLRGERMWHYGIMFQVDPRDETTLLAYLPLAVDDEEHVRRNVV